MEKDPNLIKDYVVIAIALLALIQPWLIWIWRKYIKPTTTEFYETAKIELGYSQYATTIGINGTLRAIERDVYVNKITLELERVRDSSKHTLNWAVMRGTKINLSNSQDVEVELPYGFLLSKDSPKRLNIQFHDFDQQGELSPSYNMLIDNWNTHMNKNYPIEDQLKDSDQDYKIKLRQAYNSFVGTPEATTPWSTIDRNFYLEAGDYKLTLVISTSNPNKEFRNNWLFSISEEQSQHVRSNVIKLTDFACNQFTGNWDFAYSDFE